MQSIVMLTPGRDNAAPIAFEASRMVDLSSTAMSYWGRDLKCHYANRACSDWLRVDPGILLGCALDSVLDILGLDAHVELVEAALQGECRSLVQTFHEGLSKRQGLVQYIPDVRGHIISGLLLQVSAMPSVPRLARWRK